MQFENMRKKLHAEYTNASSLFFSIEKSAQKGIFFIQNNVDDNIGRHSAFREVSVLESVRNYVRRVLTFFTLSFIFL